MDSDFTTGNRTVDRMSRINITGNIIPAAWYKTIRKSTGKPYLNAIVILSDIVYWYRAAEIRDEGSGQFIGFRKRKWYYFNPVSDGTRGALYVNRTTPDGYVVGADGVWKP